MVHHNYSLFNAFVNRITTTNISKVAEKSKFYANIYAKIYSTYLITSMLRGFAVGSSSG